jgi:hypothetical protein
MRVAETIQRWQARIRQSQIGNFQPEMGGNLAATFDRLELWDWSFRLHHLSIDVHFLVIVSKR